MALQRGGGPFQVDRIPQHDGRRNQVEAGSTVALMLETAVADFTQARASSARCYMAPTGTVATLICWSMRSLAQHCSTWVACKTNWNHCSVFTSIC